MSAVGGCKFYQRRERAGLSLAMLFVLLPFLPAQAAPLPEIEWQRVFGGTNADNLVGLHLTSAGQFVLCGTSFSGVTGNKSSTNSGDYDGWIIGLDANGTKVWDWSFGGTNTDSLASVQQTTNGDFFALGLSFSKTSGNKTSTNYGSSDGWLIRFNTNGAKLADRSFGGTSIDVLASLYLTDDGGFLAGGGAFSGASGNKTSVNYGSQDGWLIRLDALGNKIWDMDLGGTGFDGIDSIAPTSDGGFILGARSGSAANGNKTTPNYGGNDFWVIKLDSNGNKEWERTFGGTFTDNLSKALQTPDGGYILGGYSSSGVSGNKTSPNYGGDDYWVIKLDAAGNKVWENTFGGTTNDDLRTLQMTSDGGYILGGASASGVSGNKTSPNYGGLDFWIVKIDSDGNKMWEMSFGGTLDDDLSRIQPLDGGGYLLAGTSYSGISGNKTVGNFGSSDFWCVKLGVPAPRLTVTRSTGNIILSWPSASGDFQLQQNGDLRTTNWDDVMITPADDGTNKNVTLPISLPPRFYRLRGL